jgi:site-specific DNA-methyltransferase (adenine-specific)
MTQLLIHGDCLEKLKDISDKSIDCFICDLPYGCLHPVRKREPEKWYDSQGQAPGCSWDVKIDLDALWKEIKRLCKDDHTPVIMFCNTKFGFHLYNSNPSWFRYDLVWNKERGVSFLAANKRPMTSHEMIYIFSKKGAFYKRIDVKTDKAEWDRDRDKETNKISTQYNTVRFGTTGVQVGGKDGMRCPLSVLEFKSSTASSKHPTEKPVELYKWLLSRYCPEAGTVLDPTFGSGNSGKAAVELGLNYIGIEKDEGFFNKANGTVIEHIE